MLFLYTTIITIIIVNRVYYFLNGVHNHAMKLDLEGYMIVCRLKEDDKKIVCDLTKSKVHPRNILLDLKRKRQDCMTNIRQIYTERQQIWKSNRGDKKALQFLISKLEEHNYVYFSRTQSESTTIEDIFWVHPTSVKLFNNFPTVLVIDYKTNMYKMSVFEIVGVTMSKTVSARFYRSSKKRVSFQQGVV